jgi:MFS family permease
MPLDLATNLYVIIGIAGIFTMPLLGIVADKAVVFYGNEVKGRKAMLILAPSIGIVASILLLLMKGDSIVLAGLICVLFATYWAIEPGGVVGYAGSIYGNKSLGKLWGLATWIIMGIGPALGSFMGGYLADTTGNFVASIQFAMGAFIFSLVMALTMPLSYKTPEEADEAAGAGEAVAAK